MELTTAIVGMGTAVPEHRIAQQDAAAQIAEFCGLTAEQQVRVEQIHQQAGVATRHSVVLQSSTNGQPAAQTFYPPAEEAEAARGPTTSARMRWYEQHAGPLAQQAAEKALTDASAAPSSITHLITVSCSGFVAPGVDLALINSLGLRRDVQRTHVGFMGCHGALNGLRVAKAFVDADPQAAVLMVAVELCTLHLQYGFEMQGVVSNSLFADGAAAVVCRRAAAADNSVWKLVTSGSYCVEDSAAAMGWRIGDHGFEMRLAPSVPRLIREQLRPWMTRWLASQGLTLDAIGCWAIHPGGPRILQACREALTLPAAALQASEDILSAYGNMSSPTVLFVLERLRADGARPPAVALGFGPGLAIEALLLGA